MKSRSKKPKRKTLVNKLDKVHSLFIRARDKRCVTCGSTEKLQCGHIFTRSAYATRWDLSTAGNAHAQCAKCNIRHEYDPYPFNNWYITQFGKDEWDKMHTRHKAVYKVTQEQLEFIIETINGLLAEQEKEERLFL